MRSDSELANENFVASFRKAVEHSATGASRQFGGVFAFVSDLPLSLFNGCVVVEPGGTRDLDAALRWVVARRVPHRVFVAAELEAEVAAVAAAHGLERDPVPYPGMVLHPIPDPPEPPDDVGVTPVDESGRDEFLTVAEALRLPSDVAEALFSRSFLGDADVQALSGVSADDPSATRSRSEVRARRASTTSPLCAQPAGEASARP